MASINKAIIIGNLGDDPELRYTESNTAVTTLSVATSERWKDKNGEPQEKTEWHRIVVFGRQAENCNQYLKKGRSVYIEGRIQTRKWEDKDGNPRYTTEIVAQTVQFLSGGRDGGGNDFGGPPSRSSNNNNSSNRSSGGGGGYNQAFDDDDIPF